MENVRYNIAPCNQNEVSEFIQKIDTNVFIPNGVVQATERSHYDRYSFLADDSRIALVYDTTARILSITGRSDHANVLLELFDPYGKLVKKSTVPAQGTAPIPKAQKPEPLIIERRTDNGTRAKLFVSPDSIRRRSEYAPSSTPTVFASSRGTILSTDEIYPPQTLKKKTEGQTARPAPIVLDTGDIIYPPQIAKKRVLPSYGESALTAQDAPHSETPVQEPVPEDPPPWAPVMRATRPETTRTEQGADNARPVGLAISVGTRAPGLAPRRATISFGTEDDGGPHAGEIKINTRPQPVSEEVTAEPQKRRRGRPPKTEEQRLAEKPPETEKRRRGRPPKIKSAQNDFVATPQPLESVAPEYKNGYSVKNFPLDSLIGVVKRLKSYGKTVSGGATEFCGTPHEVKTYTVTDDFGQKVVLRYATKRMTLQLQGKRSDLFGEVMSTVSTFSDYSSALENYVEGSAGGQSGKKVSDVQNKLKNRLPTAFGYLSEQSRIDFSYGIHDFGQKDLRLSDYSVLLVPAFRGLERFVFDLQSAEGIKVKMIGQAFDKDDSGKYILKSGYTQRIGSVIYAEVLVALYTEYFSQRNFFAHSDNTESNTSRSIPERTTAQRIFDHLLDVVEYNAKKLKEIGYRLPR